jgi:PAT family beta-lactamase induction signal transducer AmpG
MPKPTIFRTLFSRRMLVALIMGYAAGLPFDLTRSLLKVWMADQGVDLTTIGLFTLVGMPYALKFLWAPAIDRFTFKWLGRRRGWLLLFQLALCGAIVLLGTVGGSADPWWIAAVAAGVTFFSASQDIVIDAYRREDLPTAELGLGSSLYFYGYRIGILVAGSGGLILADRMSFQTVYLIMALCLLPGIAATLLTPEPRLLQGAPHNFKEAVIDPFIDFFRRDSALWILLFILLYKIGDNIAGAITMPFYLDIGFTKTQIGAVVKLFGFWAISLGGLVGGMTILKIGIHRSLWIFGVLQAASTVGYALLAQTGPRLEALAGVVAFENFSSGMGTAAFMAFMASITNKKFTATQYALLTSFMRIPDLTISSFSGMMVHAMGWTAFFASCALIALPGLLLLTRFAPWSAPRNADGA